MWFALSALEALVLSLSTRRSIPDVAAFLFVWMVLTVSLAVADRLRLFPTLTTTQRRVHRIFTIGFPVFITGWFWAQRQDIIPHNGLANRIQHLAWSAAMVSLFIPVLARWWGHVSRLERVVMAVGLVVLLGNAVEVVEYKTFAAGWAETPWQGLWAWRDTMLDLVMNIVGATLVAFVVTGQSAQRLVRAKHAQDRSSAMRINKPT
jgi:hypothetical protein